VTIAARAIRLVAEAVLPGRNPPLVPDAPCVLASPLLDGLLEVDYVDAVAFREDKFAHLGVPSASLMPEMDPGFE